MLLRFTDQTIFISKGSIGGVLGERISEPISDGNALEVELDISSNLLEIVGDSRHIVASVRLSCDEEVTVDELGVLVEEATKEDGHVLSHFFFVAHIACKSRVRKAGADGLIHVKQV